MKPNMTFLMLLCSLLLIGSCIHAQQRKKMPLIIFDTDMGPDYDDVGAITVLHALAAKGECRILATVASDAHPSIAPTIAVFNHYFGKDSLPVGVAPHTAPSFTAGNKWNDILLSKFAKNHSAAYPTALSIYRKVLAQQEDQSVTIVTVGFLSNLSELINSKPDRYSSLTGLALVKRKVKNWVAMAGGFPQGKEFNIEKDAAASYQVINQWPTPVLFSGFEIGLAIGTGKKTAQGDTLKSPVAWAYHYNLRTYEGSEKQSRPSWDHTAVLCAVRAPEKYFYVNGPGTFKVNQDGSNFWEPSAKGRHHFLNHKYPYEVIAKEIEDLMQYQPE